MTLSIIKDIREQNAKEQFPKTEGNKEEAADQCD